MVLASRSPARRRAGRAPEEQGAEFGRHGERVRAGLAADGEGLRASL